MRCVVCGVMPVRIQIVTTWCCVNLKTRIRVKSFCCFSLKIRIRLYVDDINLHLADQSKKLVQQTN